MSDEFSLSDDGRSVATVIETTCGVTGCSHSCREAGLLDRPHAGYVRSRTRAVQVLKAHPERVDMAVLRGVPSYIAFS